MNDKIKGMVAKRAQIKDNLKNRDKIFNSCIKMNERRILGIELQNISTRSS